MTQTDGIDATDYGSAVALIGMSGRFPGAADVDTLWQNLVAGVKGLRELTEEELRGGHLDPGQLADPRYVRVTGALAEIDHFDAAVFGVSPREAETMGPQHRLFLECSWEALESAGYCPTDAPGQVGVFGGSGFPDYIVQNLQHLMSEPGGPLLIAVGNERDSLANLVSYKLGLRGPAIGVQTFCSTSLVSVHLACQSLLTYECDLAVAGGAFTPLPQPSGYLYEPGGITSPDGIVRSFDAAANGTVMGSGVGVVALKRMTEAIEDGDVIHAVILGSATNNDGRVRAGYTAPGVDGQADVIDAAFGVAGVKAESIGYVECHATATALGDSIELAAMSRIFTESRDTPCVLGTLKPSLGHLDRASGVSGLIRAALALEHETLPGTPNYDTPNPALATALDRFTVLTEHAPWPDGPTPRRAGVSSFGLGGTNAHVVLEQAPPRPACPHRAGPHLLTFSAVDQTALDALTDRLSAFLATAGEDVDLADVAFTLQSSRGGFSVRRSVVCRDRADALAALADPERRVDARTTRRNPKVRLVDGPDVPAGWWAELQAAASSVLGAESGRTDTAGALAALGDGLTRLGVRLDPAAAAGQDVGHVEEVVVAPGGDGPATEWLLAVLGRLWQAGCQLDWAALHRGEGRRVQLPTYPFQRKRFWVDPPAKGAAGADAWWSSPTTTGRTYDRSQWTHLPTWQRRPRPTAELDEQLRLAGPWLVFSADERTEALISHLIDSGVEVTAVRPGVEFAPDDMGDFTVRVDDSGDMALLLRSLIVAPQTIVHGFSLASGEQDPAAGPMAAAAHFDAEQPRGFYSAMALARELVDDSAHGRRMGFVVLTSSAIDVAGTDIRHPEHAALAALAPTLAQENSRLRTRHVDIDAVAPEDRTGLRRLVTALLAACVGPHEGPVGVRAGELWRRRYQPFPIEEPETGPFQAGDTVLITGGLGDVGITLARHLAGRYQCRLVLTARSPLPPRAEWDDYLAAVPEGGQRTARHIRSVRDLEQRGATVLALSADVGDLEQMRAVVHAAVEEFGGIDVAVHGAGVQDSAFFTFAHLIDRSACEAHFHAKVRGFHVLQAALDGQCPDRRITLSSLAAVLGGMALAPYAAANAALDSYAAVARRHDDPRWISVDWDTWNVDPSRMDGHGPTVTDFAMAPAEAVDVFERALSVVDQVDRLVISTGSLEARLATWVTGDLHESDDGDDTDNRERHPRPDLDTPYVEPREGTEATMAEIWSRVLRIEPIGVVDNFFELGGHSLIAIDLTARIRRAFGASIPVTGLLECPTVRQLAELIDTAASEEATRASA